MDLLRDRGLARRNVRLLLQGHCVSKIGTAAFDIAFVLWMKQTMELASVVGIVMMLAKLPEILLSPLSGTIVDMTSRKKVLILSDLAIGLLVALIGIMCLACPDNAKVSVALVVVGAICVGICDSFFNPAVASFLPELVAGTDLQSANSLYRFSTTAAAFLGQFAAGFLFPLIGAPMLFLLDGASYLFSAGSQAYIRPPSNGRAMPDAPGHPFRRVVANLKEGMAYIWRYQGLKNFLFILCVYHFFVSPFTVILPFYMSDVLNVTAAWYGYAMGCFGVGLLIGFVLAGAMRFEGRKRACIVVMCFGVSAVAFLFIGIVRRLCLVLPLVFVIGVTIAIIVVTLNTIIQRTTPNSMHGRIFGLYSTLSSASIPFGMGFFGIAMDLLRKVLPSASQAPAMIFLFCGLTLCAIFVFFMIRPSFQTALIGAAGDTAGAGS